MEGYGVLQMLGEGRWRGMGYCKCWGRGGGGVWGTANAGGGEVEGYGCEVILHPLCLFLAQLVESEIVAKNCKTRCHEQNIPFYRFSPQLTNMVSAGETDSDKLVDMMLQTRIQSPQQGIAELASLFQLVANASKKNKYRRSRILAENNDL